MALPHGVLYVAGGDYLEPGYLVLWFTCIQLSYADWRDHRVGLTNALMTGTSVVDTQYPESYKVFSVL